MGVVGGEYWLLGNVSSICTFRGAGSLEGGGAWRRRRGQRSVVVRPVVGASGVVLGRGSALATGEAGEKGASVWEGVKSEVAIGGPAGKKNTSGAERAELGQIASIGAT
jgi:hypothetical protein